MQGFHVQNAVDQKFPILEPIRIQLHYLPTNLIKDERKNGSNVFHTKVDLVPALIF